MNKVILNLLVQNYVLESPYTLHLCGRVLSTCGPWMRKRPTLPAKCMPFSPNLCRSDIILCGTDNFHIPSPDDEAPADDIEVDYPTTLQELFDLFKRVHDSSICMPKNKGKSMVKGVGEVLGPALLLEMTVDMEDVCLYFLLSGFSSY